MQKNNMKKFYFLLIILHFNCLNAQIINIPDKALKEILLKANTDYYIALDINGKQMKVDTNNNLEIEVSEAQNVYQLVINKSPNNDVVRDFTGIEFFVNLKSLSCWGYYNSNLDLTALKNLEILSFPESYQIKILNISGLTKLKRLDIYGCTNLVNLDFSGVPNLEYLNCGGLAVETIDLSPLKALSELQCIANNFKTLDLSGLVNLKKLDLNNGQLNSILLNGLSKLESLNCSYNALTSLNLTGLSSLENLNFQSNKLTTIDLSELRKLKVLNLNSNFLTNINVLGCTDLENLNCNNNPLTSLDVSNLSKLTTLNCSGKSIISKLTSLNLSGCIKLTALDCSGNKFEQLNLGDLPSLINLNCSSNGLLTSLSTKGLKNLETLNCANSPLVNLDLEDSPHLVILEASSTKLEFLDLSSLKELRSLGLTGSESLHYLLLKNGRPYYSYFIVAPNLKYLCADEENIKYYRETMSVKNCEINSYCSFVPGKEYYIVKGVNNYNIDNKGCSADNSLFSNVKYTISNGSNTGSFYSTKDGSYAIPVQEGTVTIKPNIEKPDYFTVYPSSVTVTFPAQTSPFVQDFCISSNGIHKDLEISIIPLEAARPGFDAKYKIVYLNKGNVLQSGSVHLDFDNLIVDFIKSSPSVALQTENKMTWNFINLKPFESREIVFTVNINSPMETPAVNNGDILKYTVSISSIGEDETPFDNTFMLNQTVVGSYDPNDKTCLEGSIITPNLVGEYVHYMIRFENTGTYPAQNVVVKDMIDLNKFDISTLIPTSSSHSFVTKISEGNKVEFIFENIQLPFDDANNHGYIAFKIKTKPTLKVGDSFTNDANIYFDYNFPILTNKATSTFKTTLSTSDFDFSKYFVLYPNPSDQVLNISKNVEIEIKSFEIYDVLGQLIIAVPDAKTISNIDVSRLKTGNYFIKVKSDKGNSSMKFIKI
jgi:hypothetical protein